MMVILTIQWAAILILIIAAVIRNRQLDKLSDKYLQATARADHAQKIAVDMITQVKSANAERDSYKRLCSASDAEQRKVLAGAGIVPCADCRHLITLGTNRYCCSNAAGLSQVSDPLQCWCCLAAKKER